MGGRALAFPLVGALALAALYARSATSGSDAVVSFQTDSVALTGAVPQLHLRSEYEEALGRQIGHTHTLTPACVTRPSIILRTV